MAKKITITPANIIADSIKRIKFVKKANSFCLTQFKAGKQIIHWKSTYSEIKSLYTSLTA